MKVFILAVSLFNFSLIASEHPVVNDILSKRNSIKYVINNRLMYLDEQITRLYHCIECGDCHADVLTANVMLINDREVLEQALKDLVLNEQYLLNPTNTPTTPVNE